MISSRLRVVSSFPLGDHRESNLRERAKSGARTKKERGGGREKQRKLLLLLPPPSLFFVLAPLFARSLISRGSILDDLQ